jgi:hypothetical protein
MSRARYKHVFWSLLAAAALCLAAVPAALADHEQPAGQGDQPEDCEWYEPGDIDVPPECEYDEDGYYDEDGDSPPPEDVAPLPPVGPVARIGPDGRRAIAPRGAPRAVRRAINAANRLTRKPYKWGGGHVRFEDRGYDCSGAVSYVLRAMGTLQGAPVSGQLKRWGLRGDGKWITVYANKNHTYMVIAGLRFDTSGYGERGPRWRSEPRSNSRFAVRHWPKL